MSRRFQQENRVLKTLGGMRRKTIKMFCIPDIFSSGSRSCTKLLKLQIVLLLQRNFLPAWIAHFEWLKYVMAFWMRIHARNLESCRVYRTRFSTRSDPSLINQMDILSFSKIIYQKVRHALVLNLKRVQIRTRIFGWINRLKLFQRWKGYVCRTKPSSPFKQKCWWLSMDK